MTYDENIRANRLRHAVAQLVERHGIWRVLRAALGAGLRRKSEDRITPPDGLSDHLRRDTGLPTRAPERRHWPPPV